MDHKMTMRVRTSVWMLTYLHQWSAIQDVSRFMNTLQRHGEWHSALIESWEWGAHVGKQLTSFIYTTHSCSDSVFVTLEQGLLELAWKTRPNNLCDFNLKPFRRNCVLRSYKIGVEEKKMYWIEFWWWFLDVLPRHQNGVWCRICIKLSGLMAQLRGHGGAIKPYYIRLVEPYPHTSSSIIHCSGGVERRKESSPPWNAL